MEPKAFNNVFFQQEIGQWKADVIFCRDEIKVLNRYLQEIIEKNAASDMKDEIAQFQHKLSEKIEISYELIDAIRVHEEMLQAAIPDNEFTDAAQALLKEMVTEFCNSYSTLKSLFVRFLAKTDLIV